MACCDNFTKAHTSSLVYRGWSKMASSVQHELARTLHVRSRCAEICSTKWCPHGLDRIIQQIRFGPLVKVGQCIAGQACSACLAFIDGTPLGIFDFIETIDP